MFIRKANLKSDPNWSGYPNYGGYGTTGGYGFGYQQSYNPYGYQSSYYPGYQQAYNPYGYQQQPYNYGWNQPSYGWDNYNYMYPSNYNPYSYTWNQPSYGYGWNQPYLSGYNYWNLPLLNQPFGQSFVNYIDSYGRGYIPGKVLNSDGRGNYIWTNPGVFID